MRPTILALFLTGCASASATQVRPGSPKADDCQLDIYTAVEEVKRPYEVACLIDASSGRTLFDDRSVRGAIDTARPVACSCGADAILVMSATTTSGTANQYGEGTAILRAIRYTGAAPPPGAAPTTASGPAAGSERGACYGNRTCNDGLVCASDLCVRLPPNPGP